MDFLISYFVFKVCERNADNVKCHKQLNDSASSTTKRVVGNY